jgi:DNA-binding transcriptional regulator LsrR (DeoR family)
MGRLNVSIPAELAPLVAKWRRKINLSEICTQALRAELAAVESQRSAAALLARIRRPVSALERAVQARYGLAEVRVSEGAAADDRDLRETLGAAAAEYLNQRLAAGAVLALAGGRQAWCIVQHLGPRPLEVQLVALGCRQHDPHLLHAHANTLITLLWLLFSPCATARLVGGDPEEVLHAALPVQPYPTYFVVASCAPFDTAGPLARLLGEDTTAMLRARGVAYDFAYNFFDRRGRLVPVSIPGDQSIASAGRLSSLSKRPDARVVLVAGGRDKRRAMRLTLEAKLCNTLITDPVTARQLAGPAARARR